MKIAARYGFNEPKNRFVERPENPIAKAFSNYLNELLVWTDGRWFPENYTGNNERYALARKILGDVNGIEGASSDEGNVLGYEYADDDRLKWLGSFLSAFYNLIGQREIVFDVETSEPLNHLGEYLDECKTLILKADTGQYAGACSRGVVVNHARSQNLGDGSRGFVVNYGDVYSIDARSGGIINFGSVGNGDFECNEGIAVNFGTAKVNSYSSLYASYFLANMGDIGCNISISLDKAFMNFGTVEGHVRRGLLGSMGELGSVCIDQGVVRNGVEPLDIFGIEPVVIGSRQDKARLSLDRRQVRNRPRLQGYLDRIREDIEAYRNTRFPECLGVLDVVRNLGTREAFVSKLEGLSQMAAKEKAIAWLKHPWGKI